MSEWLLTLGSTTEEIPLSQGAVFGRQGADIVVDDPGVSRRHAVIRNPGDDTRVLEDLGSTNGTWVNGGRLEEPHPLRDGDEIRLGGTVFRVKGPTAATLVSAKDPSGPTAPSRPRSGSRGDVPAPEPVPSAIRRALPAEPASPGPFQPPTARSRGGSAARRVDVTLGVSAIVLFDAVALAIYFAAR